MRTITLLVSFAFLLPLLSAFLATAPLRQPRRTAFASKSSQNRGPWPCVGDRPIRERRGRVGVLKAADEDKELPASISPKALQQAFVQMDKDKSGELSKQEVDNVLKELGYTKVESKCLFDHMDVDQNGKITQQEFVKGCITEGICAIDDDAHNFEGGNHPVVSVDEGEAEEAVKGQLRGFYARLLAYTEKSKVLGEAGKVLELRSEAEFDEVVAAAGERPVVVKFFAEWCRKCIAMSPKFRRMAGGYGERAVFVKLDIEKFGDLAKTRAGVVAIPTFMVWRGGKVVDKYVAGSVMSKVPGELAQMIDANLDGFSLVEEIEEPDSAGSVAGSGVTLGPSEVNLDAMAAWRAAQAAKNTRRR